MEAKKEANQPVGAVMVVGAGIAGVQAALDLAKAGFYVHLVEKKPAIGGVMAQLDKTFPTNDCSMCILSPKLVECGRHLNIEIHTLSEVQAITGEPGNLTVRLRKEPRYINAAKCTGCGDCAKVCPVVTPDEFNMGLADWKAAYRLYPQAIPATFAIKKLDRAPCTLTCPAEINVQGYVQLIKMGKYQEAVQLIMERLPLPGVLGRICPHPCEDKCRRGELDEPVAICNLKRFAADQVDLEKIPLPLVEARPEKIAIIGSGPAGLACAYHLARKGYRPTIFEALPVAGGMLRVGIPDYRLPKEVLDREINHILRLGVELKLNTALGRDFTLDSLAAEGYKAVFLGLGCHVGIKLGVPGEEAAGVLQGVEFLRRYALKEPLTVGKRLAVIGGGNVAIDVACTARRLGAQVTIVYRRSREEMPAHHWEIEQALCEGVEIMYLAAPVEVKTAGGKVVGLVCQRMELGEPDASGRRRPVPIPGSEFELPVDMVIPAIGQKANLSFLEGTGIKLTKWGTIEVDDITYETSRPGVFAAGDVHTGPWIAIEAVGGGIEAAESIHRYLRGVDLKEGRVKGKEAQARWADIPKDEAGQPRQAMATLPPEYTCACFDEIAQGYTEAQAQAEASRCLNCGICSECFECVRACQAGAVDHQQQPEVVDIQVGGVILAPGFAPFDPSRLTPYQYGKLANVVTSLEFERILSATGPYEGHLVRPSDHKEPKKIAWLQCVGSRDLHHCDNSYCSAVCCMYAIKEAVIAKEHSKEPLDCAIFFMDMRTHGKDFEKYYLRAQREGVRFIRSRVHTLDPVPGTDDIAIRYIQEDGTLATETFDMVVLSVGLTVPEATRQLADRLGVELLSHGFAKTDSATPVASSVPGVYVCGTFQGPKDIPESVMEASAAAAACAAALGEARWTRTKSKEVVGESIDVSGPPRIGVFVCNCGINIGGICDVPAIREFARTLPNVVYVEDNLFTCSQDTQVEIAKKVREHNINRVVVAACTPITHEPMFRETLMDIGLNKYLFEMANIRNQDSWVHMKEPAEATEKAKDLVRMAVARASLLKPLVEIPLSINQRALVIGGGVAGMTAALNLADQGFETILLEKEKELGGLARKVHHTIDGLDVDAFLDRLIEKVKAHEKIQVLTEALVVRFSGYKGNFVTEVLVGPGMYERKMEHGALIVATGAQEYKPTEFLYGQHDRIMTQLDLARRLHLNQDEVADWQQVVMIQCVGSRNDTNPTCSRICCQGAVKYALTLKDLNPDMDVVILYRDMRTYGLLEDYYKEARGQGVLFVRFDPGDPPQVTAAGGELTVTFKDHVLGRRMQMHPDALILSAATVAADTEELASLLKLPRNAEGFFIEAHAKLRPVDFSSEGIFLAGTAHGPKLISESIAQAYAAASRAGAFLADTTQTISGVVAHVDPTRCAACLICVRSCPYGVPQVTKDNVAYINEAMCQGCGICASECPAKTIQVSHFEDDQIMASIRAAFV